MLLCAVHRETLWESDHGFACPYWQMELRKAERRERYIQGFLSINLVYSWSVCFLFKPDTAKHRWSCEAGREKADFMTGENQKLQSKNWKFQDTEVPTLCWKLVLKANEFVINKNLI